MLQLAGFPVAALLSLVFSLMKTHSTAFRSSAVAACVFAALSSYAQSNPATAEDAATLGTTVVTAGRTAQSLNDVIADMTIVDRATIEKSGANSLADILARQPGIELVRNGGPAGTTSLFVRGAPSQYTAVLIDGVRADSQAGTGGASWNSIPASQIEHIEILRGPCAAVYGSDAMAGVIQIFTRKGRQGFHPSLEFGFGTHNTQKVNASVRGGTATVDYALSIGYEKSKGYDARPNVATANHDRDGYSNRSAALNLGWNINSVHRLELTTLDSHTKGQYDTSAANDTTINDTRTLGLNWQAKWNENYQSRVSITQGTDFYQTKPSVYETTTDIKTYLWHNEYRQGVHSLTADIERREDHIKNTSLTPSPLAKRSQNAFALGYGLSLNAHSLQLNLRQDDDSDFGRKSTGNLGYALSFGDGWRISASTGTAFRAPSLYQRFSIYGSPNLRAEEGRSHELSLRYANSGNELSLTAYNSSYKNQIIFGPAGTCGSGCGCYVNVAKAKNRGFTLTAATSVKDVRLTGSLDLQKPIDVATGQILARRARQTLKLTADTQIAGFNLGAEIQRVGRRFDGANGVRPLKAYSLLNLSASKPIAKGWEIVGRVDNLGNKDYETAKNYATGGRQFYIGLRWQGE